MIYLLAHPTVLSVPAQVPALEAVDPVLAVEAPAIAPSLRSSISSSSIETSSSFILFMPFACHARSAIYLIAVGVIHLTATLLTATGVVNTLVVKELCTVSVILPPVLRF